MTTLEVRKVGTEDWMITVFPELQPLFKPPYSVESVKVTFQGNEYEYRAKS